MYNLHEYTTIYLNNLSLFFLVTTDSSLPSYRELCINVANKTSARPNNAINNYSVQFSIILKYRCLINSKIEIPKEIYVVIVARTQDNTVRGRRNNKRYCPCNPQLDILSE